MSSTRAETLNLEEISTSIPNVYTKRLSKSSSNYNVQNQPASHQARPLHLQDTQHPSSTAAAVWFPHHPQPTEPQSTTPAIYREPIRSHLVRLLTSTGFLVVFGGFLVVWVVVGWWFFLGLFVVVFGCVFG